MRPKLADHGICTSYISNDQIATAVIKHPVLGFSNYENSAFLLAGNYDLNSNKVINNYSTSIYKPYNILPPREMINRTRQGHNEIVIERLLNFLRKYKRLPNYIIYFVDGIDDPNNFSSSNSLYQETLQAACCNCR